MNGGGRAAPPSPATSRSSASAPKSNGGTPKPLRAPPPIPAAEEDDDSSEYEYETEEEEEGTEGVEKKMNNPAGSSSNGQTYEERAENILENEDNPSLDYIDEDGEDLNNVVKSPKRKKKQTFISGTIDIDILLGKSGTIVRLGCFLPSSFNFD